MGEAGDDCVGHADFRLPVEYKVGHSEKNEIARVLMVGHRQELPQNMLQVKFWT